MSVTLTKGTGIRVNKDEEIFQIGKDWVVVNFKNQSSHYFYGKREAMQFLKQFKEANNYQVKGGLL